jgi:Rieske Fe-S protein
MLSDNPFKSIEDLVAKSFKVKSASNRWSSQYFESVDGLPYIGKLNNGKASILAASGFGGNGMIYGTVSAHVLQDIIMEQENPAIELFSPLRHKPLAAAKNFVKENIDVASQLVRKLLPKKEIKSREDLSLQEGSIFKADGQPLAIYREAKDKFSAIDPTCSHMKCQVVWNQIEKSWDCPCHGARYDTDGKVITGPADFNLKKMEAIPILDELESGV